MQPGLHDRRGRKAPAFAAPRVLARACTLERAPARWNTGLSMATPTEASSAIGDALRTPPPANTPFRTGTPRALADARPLVPLRGTARPDGGTSPKEMRR